MNMNDKTIQISGSILIAVLITLATYQIVFTTIIDPDGWFHIVSGQQISKFDLDYEDLYWSHVTDNYYDVKFTWLGDVALHLVHDKFGEEGLIWMRVLFLFICCSFIWFSGDRIPNFFKIGVILCMIVAMYEKMLIRNSMFAMPYLGALLYSLHHKKYYFVPAILLFWSFTHGSYLLGIGIAGLHLFGDLLNGDKKLFRPLIAFAVIFLIIGLFNPMTFSNFSIASIKNMLSGNLFGNSASMDFKSPFSRDLMHLKFVTFFAIGTILLVKIKNPIYVLIFTPIVFFGLTYIRMTSYIAIIGGYLLFVAEKTGNLRKVDKNVYIIATVGLVFFLYLKPDLIINSASKTGLEASRVKFPVKNAEFLLKNYPGEDTFTTLSNGGFLLSKWYPHKKVFIDTHWAPHSQKLYDMWNYYCRYPDKLTCNSAIICLNDYRIIKSFAQAKTWFPKSIDQGSVVFTREPSKVHIFVTQEEIDKMTGIHEIMLSNLLVDLKIAKVSN